MVDPDASTWLSNNVGSSNIRVMNHVITMSERNEPLESRNGISLPETSHLPLVITLLLMILLWKESGQQLLSHTIHRIYL